MDLAFRHVLSLKFCGMREISSGSDSGSDAVESARGLGGGTCTLSVFISGAAACSNFNLAAAMALNGFARPF